MSEYLTDQVLGGLINGNASKGEQQMAYKGIDELQADIESLQSQVRSQKGIIDSLQQDLNSHESRIADLCQEIRAEQGRTELAKREVFRLCEILSAYEGVEPADGDPDPEIFVLRYKSGRGLQNYLTSNVGGRLQHRYVLAPKPTAFEEKGE